MTSTTDADAFIDQELARHVADNKRYKGRFSPLQYVRHVSTGKLYRVIVTPDAGLRIESTGEPAYMYEAAFNLISHTPQPGWVRPMTEMEDGRFVDATHEVTKEIHERYIARNPLFKD